MNEIYQIHSIGMVVFLFLLSGIPWTIYSVMNPDSFLKKSMLIIIVIVMVVFIAIKAIPLEVKFNYIYPFLGGFFLPDFFSSVMKKISNKLKKDAEENEYENVDQREEYEDDQPDYEEMKQQDKRNKERKKTREEGHGNHNNNGLEKEFIAASDDIIEKRERIKRKTRRTREINIDE